MDIKKIFQDIEPYIIDMRRWFHENPELSLKEIKTSQRIKEELDNMGISYEEIPPHYGIVATIECENPTSKVIVARADIDALPVQEETNCSFVSKNNGVMHACGHDSHIAMLLGVAKAITQLKKNLQGTIKLVFQSGEEVGKGASEIIDHLEKTCKVDEVIALHIWSTLDEGEILLIPKAVFAGGQSFSVKVSGKGGHGARPDLVHDPIKAICELILSFSSIPSNYYDVLDSSVVSVGQVHSGTLGNIFPMTGEFSGTIRYFKREGLDKITEIMQRMVKATEIKHAVNIDLDFKGGVIPVFNNEEMIAKAKTLIKDIDGLEISKQDEPICAGDNYCYFLDKYKGFYAILGAGKKGIENYPQHHSKFSLEETSFRKGSEFMTRYIVNFLKI